MAGSDGQLPEELWLGKVDGEWPVQAFTVEGHLMVWLGEKNGVTRRRRAWKVRVEVIEEVELVRPAPFLRTKGTP